MTISPEKWEKPEPKVSPLQDILLAHFAQRQADARQPLRVAFPVFSLNGLDEQDDLSIHYMYLAHAKFSY